MNLDDADRSVEQFFGECLSLVRVKNRDYNPDGVAFLEVLQTCWESGTTPEQDLWGRMRKQLSALRRYLFERVFESEPPHQRFLDVANYAALLDTWDNHRLRVLGDAIEFVINHRPCEIGADEETCISSNAEPALLCERCHFLQWLVALRSSVSEEWISRQTPKPQD